jgi:Tol biopolymer transport system component
VSHDLRIRIGVLALLSLGACRDAEAPSESNNPQMSIQPPTGPQAPWPVLAFVSNLDGNDEIYRILGNGKGLTRLTFNGAADGQPSWSPDGTKLAFVRGSPGATQIYVMNADGSGQTNLSNSTFADEQPVWSPDGTRILFQRRIATPWFWNWEIYAMNANGSGQVNLSKHVAVDSSARWSPSGSQIVFVSTRDGNREIYKINADGSGLVNLTQDTLPDDRPDWSPDGQKIAFIRRFPYDPRNFPNAFDSKLYTMNADGSAQAELNPGVEYPTYAHWSPNGSTLLVQDHADARLLVLNANGSNLHVVLDGSNGVGDATWSPDGGSIALWSWVGCNVNDDCEGIVTVGSNGGIPKIVTSHVYGSGIVDWSPTWKP